MPSRTYIQMSLKLHNSGKIHLPKEMVQTLEKYNAILENHPEAIEDVVNNRVKLLKFTNIIMPDVPLLYICHIIFEQDFLDSMFAKNYRVIGTSKAAREEKIIKDNITKEEAEKFCDLWGWSYDDGEHSYYLGYEAKYEEEWQKC